jgi:trans-aconitate methyltransferase
MAEQTWNPRDYQQSARFVSDLGMGVLELLAPKPAERILDLGCGDGDLTQKLTDLGCSVVGVDASPDLIEAAKALGLDARLMDAQTLPFQEEFDAVFSNAVLHWIKDQDKVLDGVRRALKPGGRFVAEMGGKGNLDTLEKALRQALQKRGLSDKVPESNFYPSPEEYRALLEKHGLQVKVMEDFPRPTPLPQDVKAWVRTFRKHYLAVLGAEDVPAFLEEVQGTVRSKLSDPQGHWSADYVRLRFKALKP